MLVLLFLLCFCHEISTFDGYYVKMTNDGPVVLGANITFRAEVYKNEKPQQGTYLFKWHDNMEPVQNKFEEKRQGVSIWRISHSPQNFKNQTLQVQVAVYLEPAIFEWILCYGSDLFILEDQLVGNLTLKDDKPVKTYVSTEHILSHEIKLHGPDNEYLESHTTNQTVKWWIDGELIKTFDSLNGTRWSHQYRQPDLSHTVTATITAIRKISKSSLRLESSTQVDNVNSTDSPSDSKRNNATDPLFEEKSSYLISNLSNTDACDQKTQVCGTFSRTFQVKAPIKNVNIGGNNWLKHGDMLNLQVTCNGSGSFTFCKRFFIGPYKILGNETCKYTPEYNPKCNFSVDHYFRDSKLYTVLLIIKNEVSVNITTVGVNIYEVTKHPQLSVVVVPLMASILAVILIIFGVAFYFQNRNSYAIEVADFDFTNNNDLEYKTFKERLSEAIHNAFNKPEDFSEENSYNGVPSTRRLL